MLYFQCETYFKIFSMQFETTGFNHAFIFALYMLQLLHSLTKIKSLGGKKRRKTKIEVGMHARFAHKTVTFTPQSQKLGIWRGMGVLTFYSTSLANFN